MSVYSTLGRDQIRLAVLPDGPANSSEISLHLVTISLTSDNLQEYFALSYTWGSEDIAHIIKVDGVSFPIRANLMQALQAIQGRAGYRRWWIDSICINQDDNEEKEHQVARMGEIYKRAAQTIVWLGELSEEVSPAITTILKLGPLRSPDIRQAKEIVVHEAAANEFNSLRILFQRPWWTRAWTLQEFIIPDQLTFWCGDQSFRRFFFTQAMRWISEYGPKLPGWTSLSTLRGHYMAGKRRKIHIIRSQHMVGGGDGLFPLCDLMVYAGGAFATWERDCVYSVLGLASDIDILNLKPVYNSHTTTTIDIYEQLVLSQVNASACLDLISFASASLRDSSKKCPSWVPYWPTYSSKSYDRMAWQSFTALSHIHRGLAETPEQARALYRASGGCAYRCPSQTTQPGILCCQGYKLDRIDLDADPSIIDMTQRFEDQVAITGTDEQLQLKSFKHLPPENLWKTVVLDRDDTYLDKVCPIEHRDEFLQLYNDAIDSPKTLDTELLEWFVAHAEQLFGSPPQKSKIIEDLRAAEGMSYRSLSNFEDQLLHVWFNMRKSPARLESGSWAMIPPNTKSGDQVYILAGCNFPVLLRETDQDGEFELIGECYVDGFMDGQGVPLDQGNMKWQTISLV